MSDDKKPKIVYLSTTAMVAVLVTMETWFFTVYSFLGSKDAFKHGVCTGLSVAASVFLATVGRRAMGGDWPVKPGQSIGVTGLQACWVTALMIAAGLFYMWMFE